MREEIFVYFIGTAGSGKSTLTYSFQHWFELRGLDAITVNLDPGAEDLPYEPDVDIRDWISLKEIMDAHGLGPNGAQIVCADMIALNTADIKKSIKAFKSDYILVDTPGQIELFVFREAGKYTVRSLNPERTMVFYLIDPALAKTASGFVSQLLLSINTSFRLNQPQINVLSKTDILSQEEMDIIKRWSGDPDQLYNAVTQEEASVYREMTEGILCLIRDFGGYTRFIHTAKENFFGMEDLYTAIQIQFEGGEDLMSD
ncbi:MAG: GTPase [Thermoplasmata archaeon]|nr:MAG: GTPase [Thermoplasmata archaeon]RLF35188.1 MAG: GTPase [Thermoplasmata archaeon]